MASLKQLFDEGKITSKQALQLPWMENSSPAFHFTPISSIAFDGINWQDGDGPTNEEIAALSDSDRENYIGPNLFISQKLDWGSYAIIVAEYRIKLVFYPYNEAKRYETNLVAKSVDEISPNRFLWIDDIDNPVFGLALSSRHPQYHN